MSRKERIKKWRKEEIEKTKSVTSYGETVLGIGGKKNRIGGKI